MVSKGNLREPVIEMGAEGGNGRLDLDKLAGIKVNPSNVGLYAHARLEPGATVGYHVHHNECELYYILSGKGLYSDNGIMRGVYEGDVTYTPSGEGHSLENIGDDVLEFMALIVKD